MLPPGLLISPSSMTANLRSGDADNYDAGVSFIKDVVEPYLLVFATLGTIGFGKLNFGKNSEEGNHLQSNSIVAAFCYYK